MPAPAEALWQEARALQQQGQRAGAIVRFEQGLRLDPAPAERWYEFGYLLRAAGRYAEAMDAFGAALARGIARAEEVHLNRAVLLADHLRRDDEAEAELEAALALRPDYVPALLNLGNLHEQRGRRELALASYARVLALADPSAPGQDLAYEALSRSAVLTPPAAIDETLLARLRAASERAQANKHVRANLLFALGRCCEALGRHDEAFDAFARANRTLLRMAGRTYHREHAERHTAALIDAFPRPAPRVAAAPSGAPEPLFICGMFRSGSTLLERILDAHPRVVAGGELDYMLRLAEERLAPFPASVARLDDAAAGAYAAEYRALLADRFPQAGAGSYVSDKRPDNFQLIGLIKRLFPGAKIIHTTRHPLDTGLSAFVQHLVPQVAGYACDLADIGHYFGQYRRLMAHWKALYPADILEVHYDALVRDPAPILQRLFAALGLDWDERCLDFHRREGTVKTASYWQVRRPLYTESSGRWRHYAAQLGPLRQALIEAGVAPEELD